MGSGWDKFGYDQGDKFVGEVIDSKNILNLAIKWIGENYQIDEVFDSSVYEEFAKKLVSDKMSPEDVFSDLDLHDWAIKNGYVEEE